MSQSPFEMPNFFDFFGIFGIIVLVIIILTVAIMVFFWIFFFTNILRGRRDSPTQGSSSSEPFVVQREVIREIVKVRCPYCNQLYEEKLDTCPYCGAKKP